MLQGKNGVFVAMPSYKTKQTDESGKSVYQDVCYPVRKEFREKLYWELTEQYELAKSKPNEKEQSNVPKQEQEEKQHARTDRDELPFR